MADVFTFLRDLAAEHWPALLFSLVGLAAGAVWGRWRARRQWSRRSSWTA